MATVDLSRQVLPPEILEIIGGPTPNLLDIISEAALRRPELTDRLYAHFDYVFPDVCARWTLNFGHETANAIASFARVLPFAPYLSSSLEKYLKDHTFQWGLVASAPPVHLQRFLLAAWRLNSFDLATYGTLTSPLAMQSLFQHGSRAVRYLAIRIFCQLLRASDFKMEALIREHVGMDEAILGDFDGRDVDYMFLSLAEHGRLAIMTELQQQTTAVTHGTHNPSLPSQRLTPLVVVYGNTMLPRPLGPTEMASSLISTPTVVRNLEGLAKLLQKPGPIMLHGLPGSGKTSLIHEIARDLSKSAEMVTLHLNEQTDAKMLIGLYSTGSKPGTFEWRPGVLTKAVREGRWVLVEDLDRAPAEVISSLLPLVERRELLIPSRSETIQAASGFRLFATVRTTKGMHGKETLPHLLGLRFWQLLGVESLPGEELRDVLLGAFPVLEKFVPQILAVYKRVCRAISMPSAAAAGRGLLRQMTLRDLLRWCRRLKELIDSTGSKETISESTRERMLMEAADCFLGHLPEGSVREGLLVEMGREMHWSESRIHYYLTQYKPPIKDSETMFQVGRAAMPKLKSQSLRFRKPARTFADTTQSIRLLEQLARSVQLQEPVLLVGETGIGKTTVVQQLAGVLGRKLIAVNLSQQSEAGDLLGGFKPINTISLAMPLKDEFDELFQETGLAKKNTDFLAKLGKWFSKGQWSSVYKGWRRGHEVFEGVLRDEENKPRQTDEPPVKRQKRDRLQRLRDCKPGFDEFAKKLEQFKIQISHGAGALTFSFAEGHIVKAARNGDWVLLDEINLASSDTLESIADLLDDTPSLLLSESGEIERIQAHPNFRIFGAMNPATDVGKRDLPQGIRSRFTEIFVNSPDRDRKDLIKIVKAYMGDVDVDAIAGSIADLYLETKQFADERRIVDGANEVPHFSLRTLTRVLTYARGIERYYGLKRAVYEGFSMGFLTLLNRESEEIVDPRICHYIFKTEHDRKSLLSKSPKRPDDGRQYVIFESKTAKRKYWLLQGHHARVENENYIISRSVERNLLNLVRATSNATTGGGGYPVLIQGPTSSGKTSMIEYLANFSGNKFVRINNHEHTDLQEYLGTYVSGSDGQLRFQDGLLVQAMRNGYWIVLDELNLAPTDVLEALNRLLDDNRELLIPETQEVVRPHEHFRLFATQNPPGLYGGRKVLSRAFRNRFLELHFDDIPRDELEFILEKRAKFTSGPDCRRIVAVYDKLSKLRQRSLGSGQKDNSALLSNLFKDGFATLRDLFRWALRDADNREQIAANGFMLLGERTRDEQERQAIKEIIEGVFKVKLDTYELYSESSPLLPSLKDNSHGIVWTHGMRRLYALVAQAIRNGEPVLLVGETGCGKTSVCQVLAEALEKELYIVNAHQNTETGDIIGSQRPIRNRTAVLETLETTLRSAFDMLQKDASGSLDELLRRFRQLSEDTLATLPKEVRESIAAIETRSKSLFEWSDGSLVHAMKTGQFFLLDEISLADDSVLERLNSVLEPHRTLLLAEKGIDDPVVKAQQGFQFFATMNPGGDFGKKELSPALRNRFTEIWVPPLAGTEDMLEIVASKLHYKTRELPHFIVDFSTWFGQTFRSASSTAFSIRELLVWVQFMNECQSRLPDGVESSETFSLVNGAATVFIDSLGANPAGLVALDTQSVAEQRSRCLYKLGEISGRDVTGSYEMEPELVHDENSLSIGGFSIPRNAERASGNLAFFEPPTTRLNALRVVRALQMRKPILLEGSPGVGKTTLVAALAQVCGCSLTRINLSDQTDLMDLFGTDVPVDGAEAGNFAWRDAPFLRAMQRGEWVLLDEMNLASQSVLEGLNACLDHRGEVYISELDQVFKRHPDFRLFAAQNPHHQGGGRKGLPSSFVNRFVVVYADVFSDNDLHLIASKKSPATSQDTIGKMIQFITTLERRISQDRSFGSQGAPWEFNLRDLLRWLQLLGSDDPLLGTAQVDDFLDIIVRQRFRTSRDRHEVTQLFSDIFGRAPRPHNLYHDVHSIFSQVGLALVRRHAILSQPVALRNINFKPLLSEIESLMICVTQNIPVILSGPPGSGKSVLVQHMAALAGKTLVTFPLNADVDTMDLVGGFEQSDPLREVNTVLQELETTIRQSILLLAPQPAPDVALRLLSLLRTTTDGGHAVLLEPIEALCGQVALSSELHAVLSKAAGILKKQVTVSNPRFEWLDGVILKALESGHWLVLDNANLCSASVLDRLNSLMEPDGLVSVNEHCGPTGEPRIVRPHADFRIFLTMDPRYGELSRAMRNRVVEIHLSEPMPESSDVLRWMTPIEGSLQRFSFVTSIAKGSAADTNQKLVTLALQNLTETDVRLLSRFSQAVGQGIMGSFGVGIVRIKEFLDLLQTKSLGTWSGEVSRLRSSLPSSLAPNISKFQPISPTRNLPVVPLLAISRDVPFWLAAWLEIAQEIQALEQEVQRQTATAKNSRLSSLNRLQRSLVADRVAAVAKDSTAGVSKFLRESIAAVYQMLQAAAEPHATAMPLAWKTRSWILQLVLHHLWRTFRLVNQSETSFDEAVFQAHLTQMKSRPMVNREEGMHDPEILGLLGIFHGLIREHFDSGFSLVTGQSMEQLWKAFQSEPISNTAALQRSLEVTALAKRFDKLRWKAPSPVADLAKVVSTLSAAFGIILHNPEDASSLVQDLKAEIEALEVRIGLESVDTQPYFASDFELLRQALILRDIASGGTPTSSNGISILSNTPTTAELHIQAASGSAQQLQFVDLLTCQAVEASVWNGLLAPNLLSKADRIGSTALSSMALLEMELPQLGRQLSKASHTVIASPFSGLAVLLRSLLLDVVSAHDSGLAEKVSQFYEKALGEMRATASPISIEDQKTWCPEELGRNLPEMQPSHLRNAFQAHFHTSWCALLASTLSPASQSELMATAWIQFAIGSLKLYVPNRILDPHLRQRVETESHLELQDNLSHKLSTLIEFGLQFTGQPSSLHTDLVREELEMLGDPPEAGLVVYRPTRSELGQIHAEFNSVLKATAYSEVLTATPPHQFSADELALVSANVARVIERLSGRFESYQDMIRPSINLLRCLQLGLSLIPRRSSLSEASLSLVSITPFLGGTQVTWQEENLPSRSFEFMDYLALTSSIDGVENLESEHRQSIFACFHAFYNEWIQKLEADRKEEEAKQSLYRFKGSFEDEEEINEEEFNQLFPTYDGEDQESVRPSTKKYQVRDMSIKVAETHRRLLVGSGDASGAMREAVLSVGRKVASDLAGQKAANSAESNRLLPVVLLLLDEKMSALNANTTSATYNFYTDPNVTEARQLVQVVSVIKTRFRELQLVDEIGHLQPLADVQTACEKVLELLHTEPLAKMLPKVELLHAYVYEWQFGGWAARVHSAPELYERLTSTIVRWRRLELSTWAKLFEMEAKKCQDDANSWWFVAYQATVANSVALAENESTGLQDYAASLMGDLETYFSSSILGQFSTRLNLLRQFHCHLQLLVKDYPAVSLICDAVGNFISMYRRYQKPIDEAIARGRAPLDKKMKDVLLLASWKDTNINALRESARKSHQKLFRLVRKFREVLGQPAKQILEQGLPDEEHAKVVVSVSLGVTPIDESAIALADKQMVHWLQKRGRLFSVKENVIKMSNVASVVPAQEAIEDVEAFILSLTASIQELRKETPAFLEDENKEKVKHLKSRKRKLFADILRQLRQMGFEYNLDTSRLGQQDSTQAVLVRGGAPLAAWPHADTACVEYFYHKFVDLMPRVRRAASEHSEDLTGREVARSIGFLEGILHVVIKQRVGLAGADSLLKIEQIVDQLRSLARSTTSRSARFSSVAGNLPRSLGWLVEVLQFATQLVQVHSRLSQDNNLACLDTLNAWLAKLREDSEAEKARQRRLPPGFIDDVDSQAKIVASLTAFKRDIQQMAIEYPNLEFILLEVLNWTSFQVDATTSSAECNILDFASQLSRFADEALESAEAFGNSADEDVSSHVAHTNRIIDITQSLNLGHAAANLSNCIHLLHGVNLSDQETNRSVAALLAMFVPVADQYVKTCRNTYSILLGLHNSTVQLAHCLAKNFANLASQGFCTPQEKSDETSKGEGKLESGTGLGDGEGAEDISKDIQPDEDLTELAQEPNKEKKDGDIEDEKDAVDMADEDLEGEMGSVGGDDEEEDKDKDGEESGDEMDEEAGDVDDLDATAKDEKMWEDDGKEAEKDQQGEKPKGKQKTDELMAAEADEQMSDQEGGEGEPEPVGDEEDEAEAEEPMNRQDQNVEQNEVMDLPEDLDLNFEDDDGKSEDSDGLDDLSDLEQDDQKEEVEADSRAQEEPDEGDPTGGKLEPLEEPTEDEENDNIPEDETAINAQEPDDEPQQDKNDADEDKCVDQPTAEAMTAEVPDVVPSDARSGGQDYNQTEDAMDLDEEFRHTTAQQEQHGEAAEGTDNQDNQTGGQGAESKEVKSAQQRPEQDAEKQRTEPFKKLGNALEKWHRQRADIKQAGAEEEKDQAQQDKDAVDVEQREFQHLQNDDATADAQAMGAATEEEVQPIDDAMVIDEEKEDPASKIMPDVETGQEEEDTEMEGAEAEKPTEREAADSGLQGAMTRQGTLNVEDSLPPSPTADIQTAIQDEDSELEIQETSNQLDTTHLDDTSLRPLDECVQQWLTYQTKTAPLSQSLTSQLRLILTPSQSTKISGSFRTGKRLNIKRIIPYIASGYKRDKIWMRRAVPTKRAYQILLCLDDSYSMGLDGAGEMAVESLVMVAKSLSMLEVGQVGVLGFGEEVFTAHDLSDPLTPLAGGQILRHFSFAQNETDVLLLCRRTLERFRNARVQSQASMDLWQLAIILSDGVCQASTHDGIKRLLREALEERVMFVFVVLDSRKKRKGKSVLSLMQAWPQEDGNMKLERYFDGFPFGSYLVVDGVEGLPTALSGVLRMWFAEVNA